MEKLIKGTGVTDSEEFGGENGFAEFHMLVRKGHEECGDSAFVYSDGSKLIAAVFDGVSGEAGAASASSNAAEAILASLKGHDRISEKRIKDAILSAQEKVIRGYTTAVILFLEKTGAFIIAGVGDSPAYGIDNESGVGLELPLARTVGDNDSILKFFYYRNIVSSVLGSDSPKIHVNMKRGKLREGQMLILASDGLSDNLYVVTSEGYVTDSSGASDLKELIGEAAGAERIVKVLAGEVERRIRTGKIERRDSMLVPKEDDLGIIAVRFGRPNLKIRSPR